MPSRYVSYRLNGIKALVTGGASGIGLGTAKLLARAGAKVAINHLPDDPRGAEEIAKLKAEGLDVIAAPGQVGVAGETEQMVADAIRNLGGLDLLFNNAGTPGVRETVPVQRLDLVTDELWETVLSTNLMGVFRCTKAAAEALKASKGAVVNTASIASFKGPGSSMAYGATKAGIMNLTQSFAKALAPHVRVNAIAPGAVDSPWLQWTEEQKKSWIEKSPLKRVGAPEDYGDVVLFLAFGNETVTGQTLIVDAGMTL